MYVIYGTHIVRRAVDQYAGGLQMLVLDRYFLFADAELTEDAFQQIVAGGFAGDLAEGVVGSA